MNASKLRPGVVLWWGIGLTAAGFLLTLVVPQLGFFALSSGSASTPLDQGMLVALETVVRVVAQVVPPLGVVLIGAAIVMAYVGRVVAGAVGAVAAERAREE